MYIKAPYNFVPLNENVVTPHWGKHISHDVPFKDGQSGVLKVKIKAHSPIFVRDGVKEEADTQPGEFTQFGEKGYFIPGSSIKGMLRNVLEIMSFSKMGNKVDDKRYAVREFGNPNIYNPSKISRTIKCGWLHKNKNDDYFLVDCDTPGRIELNEIDKNYQTKLNRTFRERYKRDEERYKTAIYKYKIFKDTLPNHSNQKILDILTTTFGARIPNTSNQDSRKIHKIDLESKRKGTIVFTGQPSDRKRYEFIFFEKENATPIPVNSQTIENFFFAYFDKDSKKSSDDWKYWSEKLRKGERIPVFYRNNEINEVKDLGLSFLYKISYDNSIKQSIEYFQKEKDIDLSEAIFGYIDKDSGSLKGRVHIGHAFANKAEREDKFSQVILSSPKASFYPTYMHQEVDEEGRIKKKFKTLMGNHQINGWKRYPVHKNIKSDSQDWKEGSTSFFPIKEGAEFNFEIRYHNLKKIELGALISAINFHGTDKVFHSLGLAKPLGYGKVTLHIEGMEKEFISECMRKFECYMNASLNHDSPKWNLSKQMKNLLTMASEQDNFGRSELSYLKMSMNRYENEFLQVKKNTRQEDTRQGLDRYAKLPGIKIKICPSLATAECIAEMKNLIQIETEIFNKKKSHAGQFLELKEQKASEFYTLFENKKQKLRDKIQAKSISLSKKLEQQQREYLLQREKEIKLQKEKERIEKLERNRAIATSQGINLTNLKPSNRAFDELKKTVRVFLKKYHGSDDIHSLPNEYHEEIVDFVKSCYELGGKKDKKNWDKSFTKNANLKKIAQWIGEEKAKNIFNK